MKLAEVYCDYGKFRSDAESRGVSGDDAITEFWNVFSTTAQNFLRMAFWLRYAEEKGTDLTAARLKLNGFYVSLRRLAYGQLRADLMVRYCDKLTLLKRLGTLPLADQDAILADGGVKVLVYDSAGQPSHIVMDPGEMTKEQIHQAFDADHIRTESEQAAIIHDWRTKRLRAIPENELYGVVIDPSAGVMRSEGAVSLTMEQLAEILKVMRKGRRSAS